MLILLDMNNCGGYIILIDIEGINFKDNEIIDLFYIFIFFIFFGLVLLVRERINSYNVKFLY